MRNLILVVVLSLCGVLLGVMFGIERDTNKETPAQVAPELATLRDLSLPDVNRVVREGDEWLGNVVVVNHWATWCPPCLEEIPMLIQYHEEMEGDGVQVVGVSHDQLESTLRFGDEIGIPYPSLVAIVEGDKLLKSHGNTGSGALPYTVVFDREGNLVRTFLGKVSRLELENMVSPFL